MRRRITWQALVQPREAVLTLEKGVRLAPSPGACRPRKGEGDPLLQNLRASFLSFRVFARTTPGRRRHAQLALERAVERCFGFVADIGRDLTDLTLAGSQ